MAGSGRMRTEKNYAANCIGCGNFLDIDEITAKRSYAGAVKVAQEEHGWRRVGGKWTCPRCLADAATSRK